MMVAVVLGAFSGCGGCGNQPVTEEECEVNAQCGVGRVCVDKKCVASTVCGQDGDCNGWFCVEGLCQASPAPTDGGFLPPDAGSSGDAGTDAGTPDAGSRRRLAFDPPGPIEFGAARLGTPVSRMVTLQNVGEEAVTVFSLALSAGASAEFTFTPASVTQPIPVGGTVAVTITHLPVDGAPDNARLQAFSDGTPNPVELALVANFKNDPELDHVGFPGVGAPDGGVNAEVTSVEFGDVGLGFLQQRRVFIRNLVTESALELQAPQIMTDAPPGVFNILADRTFPTFLSQWNASCVMDVDCAAGTCVEGACRSGSGFVDQVTFTIQFQPTELRAYTATVLLRNNDEGGAAGNPESPLLLTITGTGKSNCPTRPGTDVAFDLGTQQCSYTCRAGFVDLNMDVNALGASDGCEYECTAQPTLIPDVPDLSGVDADCDGVDGTAAIAVFVWSGANPLGADGSRTHPYPRLQDGLAAAGAANPKKPIYLADGIYGGATAISLLDGVSIYGGYLATQNWRLRGGNTLLGGTQQPLTGSGITTPTTLQLFTVQADSGTAASPHSIALRLHNSPGVTLEAVNLTAGAGAVGVDGTPGGAGFGGAALNGGVGVNGCDGDNSGGGIEACNELVGSNPAGGAGGTAGTNAQCSGGAGGAGGRGGFGGIFTGFITQSNPATPGINAPNGGGTGGNAGGRAASCPVASCDTGGLFSTVCWGANGVDGFDGPAGEPGNGGNAGAALALDGSGVPLVGRGTDGTTGVANALGGGGGGAGGGGDCTPILCGLSCLSDGAAGGGGGGAGGCPGTGGGGGFSGGSSIALLLNNSPIQVKGGTLTSANAGAGGRGGDGGEGGVGGQGGAPGNPVQGEQRAGLSGRGGDGGKGGHGGGGGGGSGGLSYAIYALMASPNIAVPNAAAPTLVNGSFGAGGLGGQGAVPANGDSCQRNQPAQCGRGVNGAPGTAASKNF